MSEREMLTKLRERLTERRDYATAMRRDPQERERGQWTRGYWTGAMDGYNMALAALDAISAAQTVRS